MEFKSIIDKIKKTTSTPITFAVIFALSIIAQCEVFHYQIFHEFAATSIVKAPKLFFLFHLPKISIALFMASFIFIFPRKWWTIAISFTMSLWIYANIFYYRVNYAFIDEYSIKLAGNMDGFWDSIFGLIQPSDWIYLGITAIIAVFAIITIQRYTKNIKLFFITITSSIITGIVCGALLSSNSEYQRNYYNPILSYKAGWINNSDLYIQDHSIYHYFFYIVKDLINNEKEDKYILTLEEETTASKFINTKKEKQSPKTPLIICLIESLDDFVVRPEIMPNLFNFIHKKGNLLYAKVKTQVKEGISSDGQLIIETGLLPISQGTVCYRFYNNVFPSLSSLYKKSANLFPHGLNAWNQHAMSKAYKVDTNYVTSTYADDSLMSITKTIAQKFDKVLMVTMSTHAPYYVLPQRSRLEINSNYSDIIKDYIKSFNVVDYDIKDFLNEIPIDENLKSSTIVIVGDHTAPIVEDDQVPLKDTVNFSVSPLIIYSPSIEKKVIIDEECYQMDIYPTIMHLIGCDDYYWKGFGVNLLDSTARANRPISAEEAFILSDKLIRANYFEKYEK